MACRTKHRQSPWSSVGAPTRTVLITPATAEAADCDSVKGKPPDEQLHHILSRHPPSLKNLSNDDRASLVTSPGFLELLFFALSHVWLPRKQSASILSKLRRVASLLSMRARKSTRFSLSHSEHRFPAPSSCREGCCKAMLVVWVQPCGAEQ